MFFQILGSIAEFEHAFDVREDDGRSRGRPNSRPGRWDPKTRGDVGVPRGETLDVQLVEDRIRDMSPGSLPPSSSLASARSRGMGHTGFGAVRVKQAQRHPIGHRGMHRDIRTVTVRGDSQRRRTTGSAL